MYSYCKYTKYLLNRRRNELQFYREGNKIQLNSDKSYNNLSRYIYKLYTIYLAFDISRDKWLTDKELRFFIGCVKVSNNGLRYTSSKAMETYKETFSIKNRAEINTYLTKLESKEWITIDKKTKRIRIPTFFMLEEGCSHDISLNISLNTNDDG